MKVLQTALPGVLVLEPDLHEDARGSFFESFNQRDFDAVTGAGLNFVQDNHSRSGKGVLRGLHYQLRKPQGKLIRVVSGRILDVVADIRRSSPRFMNSVVMKLEASSRQQIWIPPGYAHGFLALDTDTEVVYKTTDYYAPGDERCIRWDDPQLAIDWQLQGVTPLQSNRDLLGLPLAQAELPA